MNSLPVVIALILLAPILFIVASRMGRRAGEASANYKGPAAKAETKRSPEDPDEKGS